MEAALVSASTGAMKPLLSKLSNVLLQESSKLKGVRRQVEFLGKELSSMKAALEVLADVEDLDPLKKEWRDNVRELSYDIEDCIDDFMVRVDHKNGEVPTGFRKLLGKLKKLKPRHEIAADIEQLKIRVIEASKRYKRYNFVEPASNPSSFGIDPRLHALYVDVGNLVAIDGPKQDITELLTKDSDDSSTQVVSVVGPGGLGKTTLANQVYNTMKSQFPCAAFVSVSRKPNMRKILRDIATEVGISYGISDDNEMQLINKLRQHLQHKRYFVVIDDVWDTDTWKIIRLALLNNNCGSRIITTTRNIDVASFCSCSQGDYVYQMKPLSFEDSKRLFFKRAFGSEDFCYSHLEEVSDGILRKCAGLPLAIITMSSLLTDQHAKDEWDRVLTAIGSALTNNPGAGDMKKILSLSYFDLLPHLKTCLLYLSAFPEDYKINTQRLINRWISEGFIHEEEGRSTYEVGESYFNDLVNRCLIQPLDVKYGQARACRVHDIILDFITCKANEENFITSLDSVVHGHIPDYSIRRLCVNNRNKEEVTMSSSLLSHVRSLGMFGNFMETFLLAFPALRVLDIEECWNLTDQEFANVEKLLRMKYICLKNGLITELPRNIGELQFLETLDIRGTRIRKLPSTVTRLQLLARLYVDFLVTFPDGMIEQMQSLEELESFGVSYDQWKPLQEFSQLTKLRALSVLWTCHADEISQYEDLQSYLESLVSSCNLHQLYIRCSGDKPGSHKPPRSLESWCPVTDCNIRKLHITYCFIDKVPNWMSSLGSLRELRLFIYCIKPEDMEILGGIPSLLFLELTTVYGADGRILVPGDKGFIALKYFSLRIELCGTSLEFGARSMLKLEHLKLVFNAHEMDCMNGASDFFIQRLPSLTQVEALIYGRSFNGAAEGNVECFASLIKTAVEKLPKRPTLSLDYLYSSCGHFQKIIGYVFKAKEKQDGGNMLSN